MSVCRICGEPAKARRLCSAHYQRWKKYGDPLGQPPPRLYPRRDAAERFWSKVSKNGPVVPGMNTACWIWAEGGGYGNFWLGYGLGYVRPHRYSYELATGKSLGELQLDHRCFNEACVNPDHLRPCTNKQQHEHRRGPTRTSESGIRGVRRMGNRWMARICHNGKTIYLGLFKTAEEAAAAYREAQDKYFTHHQSEKEQA